MPEPLAPTPYSRPDARRWQTPTRPSASGFHRSMPGYAPTRLVDLPALAAELGVASVHVKEESARFGLPAFKMLGASYAIARALSARLGHDEVLALARLRDELHERPRLVAATDGNHGRAVARTAALLGLPALVHVPVAISEAAKDAIRSEGAEVVELDAGYDDVVTAAADAAAADPTALLVQDTSWEGYEQVPQWIVDGYATLLGEVDEQLGHAPGLVIVPVGVGSLAQAVVQHYRSRAGETALMSVEPVTAAPLLTSLQAGRRLDVETSPSVMAGLTCGTVSEAAWPLLHAGLDAAVAVTDDESARAVHDLAALGVDSGPCGAASLAGLRRAAAARMLSATDHVVLLSTEGRAANPLPS